MQRCWKQCILISSQIISGAHFLNWSNRIINFQIGAPIQINESQHPISVKNMLGSDSNMSISIPNHSEEISVDSARRHFHYNNLIGTVAILKPSMRATKKELNKHHCNYKWNHGWWSDESKIETVNLEHHQCLQGKATKPS